MIEKQKGEEKKRGGGTLIKLVEATFIPSAVNYCCLFFLFYYEFNLYTPIKYFLRDI